MNKTSWIIIVSVLIALGASFFLFNKFFLINGWKVIPRTTYNAVILTDKLSDSVKGGDTDKQIQVAEELFSRQNDNQAKLDLADAYLEKASLDFKEEEYGNKALTLVNEVLSREANNYKAYLTAGYAYEVLQNYPKSLEQYNKAIELNPNYDISYVKRGHAYDLSGDLLAAEADYTKAFQLNNKNDVALMNLARIAQRKGDFENAKKYAQTVVDISEIAYVKATAYEIIGLVELNVLNYDAAISDFSKSIESYGKYSNSYINRAYAEILKVDYEVKTPELKNKIETDLIKALEIDSGNSFATVVYGLLVESTGDNKKALEYYEKALKMVDADITLGVSEKPDMKAKITQLINDLK